MGLTAQPSPHDLRTMSVHQLRDTYDISMQTGKKLKSMQNFRDAVSLIGDVPTVIAFKALFETIFGHEL